MKKNELKKHNISNVKQSIFTLIELLIVIAIIAILARMLLPALSKVRSTARGIQCASNLKSIGKIFQLYTDAYSEFLPLYDGNKIRAGTYEAVVPWQSLVMLVMNQTKNGLIERFTWCDQAEASFCMPGNYRVLGSIRGETLRNELLYVITIRRHMQTASGEGQINFAKNACNRMRRALGGGVPRVGSIAELPLDNRHNRRIMRRTYPTD